MGHHLGLCPERKLWGPQRREPCRRPLTQRCALRQLAGRWGASVCSAPAPCPPPPHRPLPSPVGGSVLLTTPGESSGGSARPRGGALSLLSAPCLGAPSPSHAPRTNAPWRAGAPKRDLALPQKPAGGPGRLDPREDGPLNNEYWERRGRGGLYPNNSWHAGRSRPLTPTCPRHAWRPECLPAGTLPPRRQGHRGAVRTLLWFTSHSPALGCLFPLKTPFL